MPRTYYRPIKDDTIISVLHFIRQEIVRDNLDGLDHVDALLRLRGADPEALVTPYKRPKVFRKGELRQMVLDPLREGPQTGSEIARKVQVRKQVLTYEQAYRRVYICLNTLKRRGLVRHEGRVWSILSRPHEYTRQDHSN